MRQYTSTLGQLLLIADTRSHPTAVRIIVRIRLVLFGVDDGRLVYMTQLNTLNVVLGRELFAVDFRDLAFAVEACIPIHCPGQAPNVLEIPIQALRYDMTASLAPEDDSPAGFGVCNERAVENLELDHFSFIMLGSKMSTTLGMAVVSVTAVSSLDTFWKSHAALISANKLSYMSPSQEYSYMSPSQE